MQCLTVGRGVPRGREAEHYGSDLCLYNYGCAKRSASFGSMGFVFCFWKKESKLAPLSFVLSATSRPTLITDNMLRIMPMILQ